MDIETLKETIRRVESTELEKISERMRILQCAYQSTPEAERKVRFDLEVEIGLLADAWNIGFYGKDEWRRQLKDQDIKARREEIIQQVLNGNFDHAAVSV